MAPACACVLELALLCLYTLINLDVKRHNEDEAAAAAPVRMAAPRVLPLCNPQYHGTTSSAHVQLLSAEGRETASWAFCISFAPRPHLPTNQTPLPLTLIPSDLASGSSSCSIKAGKRRHQALKLVETQALARAGWGGGARPMLNFTEALKSGENAAAEADANTKSGSSR